MKKLILAIAFLGFAVASTNAQTQTAPAKDTKMAQAQKMAPKTESKKMEGPVVKAHADKKAETTIVRSAPEESNGKVMKKDGTPDKRYKANKVEKGPMKADGTPDKRFKANKKEVKPVSDKK